MIHLTYSNRTEDLLDALAEDLRRLGADRHPLDPVRLVLPDRNLEAWVKQGLAQRLGIAANLDVLLLRRFVAGLVEGAGLGPLFDGRAIYDGLVELFLDEDVLAQKGLGEVRAYLFAAGGAEAAVARRRHQLARRLAVLFEEYSYSRPDMLGRWEAGDAASGMEAWQRALWLELRRRKPDFLALHALLDRLDEIPLPPDPIHVFGISHVAHAFHRILARLAEGGGLYVYTLNPCKEYWEDLPTIREARRLRGSEDDPFGLTGGGETPALALWGRPGRENIRLLDELSQCDFRARFSEPPVRCLLHQVQDDILRREPERTEPTRDFDFTGDKSIEVLAAPGLRREAEAIAARIWELVREDPSLRFNEIAVAVAARDPRLHFSHLQAAFEESYGIPYSLTDVSLLERSEVGEAVGMLLDLLGSRFERAPMVRFLTHPCVRARFPEADPAAWERLVDRLGIFLGADRSDLDGTYLQEDAFTWEQGLRRLALGAFLPAGEAFESEGERYLVEEGDAAFGALVRSLLSDLRATSRARQTTAEWARTFDALVQAYVVARGDRERSHLDRCRAAIRRIGEFGLGGRAISCAMAVEMAKEELAGLPGGVGRYLSEGVVVSTLRPMRAIPFRVIFVMGLGEGLFPAPDRRDPLDLRQLRFRPGDVSPRERDQYMFLEALLCARERFVLSYVARDEQTGDPLPPSPVLSALLEMLEKGYTGNRDALVRRIPLRHWADDAPHPAPRAAGERRAADLQAQVGRPIELEDLAERIPAEKRERFAARLGIVALPEPTSKEKGPRVVQLSHLRRFLECPLQGSALAVGGLRDDEEDLVDRPSEPFDVAFLPSLSMLREAIAAWLRTGRPLAEIWEEVQFDRRARGLAPAGVFGDIARKRHLAILQGWAGSIGEARPRVEVLRFGPGREAEQVDATFPPLELGDGIVLHGKTELLRVEEDGARTTLHFGSSARPNAGPTHRTLLRAFLDHLVLSAAVRNEPNVHDAVLFPADGKAKRTFSFAPVEPERARAYLVGLARELLEGRHAHFLPCEAYFEWKRRRDQGRRIVEEIDRLRGSWAKPSSAYGPLRDTQAYPSPGEQEAQAIYERRFGLFYELMEGKA